MVPSGLLNERQSRSALYHEMFTLMFIAAELGADLMPMLAPCGIEPRDAAVSITAPTCHPPTTYSPTSFESVSDIREPPVSFLRLP